MMREAVADITQATFLDVLLDGIERLFSRGLHLGVSPAGNFDDHVEDAIVLIRKERDVMERGDDGSILLYVDTMF